MSRFLKVIVNILIVLAVAIAVALLFPPIMGITTTIIDSQGIRTNLPVGSVTYSRNVGSDVIREGDYVLVESKDEAYEYEVVSIDLGNSEMVVKNAFDKGAEEKTEKIGAGIARVSFTIPYIGFAVIAMQSMEGMIVIGLIALFIIILYILSEVWKKKPEDEEDAAPVKKEKSHAHAERPASRGNRENAPQTKAPAPENAQAAAALGAGAAAASGAAAAAANKASEKPMVEDYSEELTEERFQRILAEAMAENGQVFDNENREAAEAEAVKALDAPETGAESAAPAADENAAASDPAPALAAAAAAAALGAASAETKAEEKAEESPKAEEGSEAKAEETAGGAEKPAEGSEGEEKPAEAEAAEKSTKERPPVRRRTLDEMIDYARKGGGDPEFRKDEVSGLDVVDYSSFL